VAGQVCAAHDPEGAGFVHLRPDEVHHLRHPEDHLAAGFDAYFEPVGFTESQAGFSVSKSTNDQGQVEFVFEAHQMDADHRAGIRLELKGRGTR
jgi:hypothetical protein